MQTVTPPKNFGIVEPGVYRCAYPRTLAQVNYLRALRPLTILQVTVEGIPRSVRRALEAPYPKSTSDTTIGSSDSLDEGARQTVSRAPRPINQATIVDLSPTAWGHGEALSSAVVAQAMEYFLDAGTHPLVVMGPSGEVETSAVVAGLRLTECWSLGSIIGEATLYASSGQPKRKLVEFVEQLNLLRSDYLPNQMAKRRMTIASTFAAKAQSIDCVDPDSNIDVGSTGMLPLIPICPLWWDQLIANYDEELALMNSISVERVPISSLKGRDDAPLSELVRFDRNPPALGPKSKFSKSSIAEEEDA